MTYILYSISVSCHQVVSSKYRANHLQAIQMINPPRQFCLQLLRNVRLITYFLFMSHISELCLLPSIVTSKYMINHLLAIHIPSQSVGSSFFWYSLSDIGLITYILSILVSSVNSEYGNDK